MIESYKTNRLMRERYLRANSITHAEIWDNGDGYIVYLCTEQGVGFSESPEFGTIGQCKKWANEFCPEIECN